jgi:hypothetical protein
MWLPTYEDRQTIPGPARIAYLQTGDLAPLVEFIEQRYFPILSNRDYRWSNELMVKLAFLTLLFDDRLYMMVSETEMDHGYIDLSLIVRTDQRATRPWTCCWSSNTQPHRGPPPCTSPTA